jgi:hypothetical protein
MYMCPFRRSSCGPNSQINFYLEKEDGAIHIIGLEKGESCSYNIESVCGAPSFKVDNATGVEIFYNEWQQGDVDTNLPVLNSYLGNGSLFEASPVADWPARSVEFPDEKALT